MPISLLKHREVESHGKIFSYFEDDYGTDLLVYQRTGPSTVTFIKRLYIPKKQPHRILTRHFFRCHCGKHHAYSGVRMDSKCSCSAYLMPIVEANIKIYGVCAPVDKLY